MHLHGFYYRVDSLLDPRLDSSRDGAESDQLPGNADRYSRPFLVTTSMTSPTTMMPSARIAVGPAP